MNDAHVQGFQRNTVSTRAGKSRGLHKSLDGSKFSGTLPHTVYFQMQKVFYQTKGINVRN